MSAFADAYYSVSEAYRSLSMRHDTLQEAYADKCELLVERDGIIATLRDQLGRSFIVMRILHTQRRKALFDNLRDLRDAMVQQEQLDTAERKLTQTLAAIQIVAEGGAPAHVPDARAFDAVQRLAAKLKTCEEYANLLSQAAQVYVSDYPGSSLAERVCDAAKRMRAQ